MGPCFCKFAWPLPCPRGARRALYGQCDRRFVSCVPEYSHGSRAQRVAKKAGEALLSAVSRTPLMGDAKKVLLACGGPFGNPQGGLNCHRGPLEGGSGEGLRGKPRVHHESGRKLFCLAGSRQNVVSECLGIAPARDLAQFERIFRHMGEFYGKPLGGCTQVAVCLEAWSPQNENGIKGCRCLGSVAEEPSPGQRNAQNLPKPP